MFLVSLFAKPWARKVFAIAMPLAENQQCVPLEAMA
jgi:hypothetical protein